MTETDRLPVSGWTFPYISHFLYASTVSPLVPGCRAFISISGADQLSTQSSANVCPIVYFFPAFLCLGKIYAPYKLELVSHHYHKHLKPPVGAGQTFCSSPSPLVPTTTPHIADRAFSHFPSFSLQGYSPTTSLMQLTGPIRGTQIFLYQTFKAALHGHGAGLYLCIFTSLVRE